MKLLLTGADGFTGRHLVAAARACGYEVHALQANLTDKEGLKAEVAQLAPEMVVHLAAISFVGYADASAFYDVNVLGTLNLLDALVAQAQPVMGDCSQLP